ncbi:hypothetical protein CGLO_08453 [Colletotrichum gloeosporioides Cg-14]|uniref:Uncharacterized protein n=1 Tax=Colletotrichum gloeosporioides (strain Cg-14) TaxID=1237896 RepID=T0KID7_COLGC|nr:hypothetical protein CGLO_08453 [Colletotrichum gloeosporioides Cg-14]
MASKEQATIQPPTFHIENDNGHNGQPIRL